MTYLNDSPQFSRVPQYLAPLVLLGFMMTFWPGGEEKVIGTCSFAISILAALLRDGGPIPATAFWTVVYYGFFGVGSAMLIDPIMKHFGSGTIETAMMVARSVGIG